jgi:hypothetical protein
VAALLVVPEQPGPAGVSNLVEIARAAAHETRPLAGMLPVVGAPQSDPGERPSESLTFLAGYSAPASARECAARSKETLNKAILALSQSRKAKTRFPPCLQIQRLTSSNLAVHPCTAQKV